MEAKVRRVARLFGPALLALAAALLAALAAHAYLGTFMRYMADDFCTAYAVQTRGLWPALVREYLTWSGRFTYNFQVFVTGLLPPGHVRLLAGAVLAAWVAALAMAAAALPGLPGGRRTRGLAAAVLALAVVVATVEGAPNVVQSVYWRAGVLIYTVPLVVASLMAGVAAWHLRAPAGRWSRRSAPLLMGALAFVAGGCTETYAAVQFAAFSLLLAASFVLGRSLRGPAIALWLAGLLGAGLALAAIAFSPGAQLRQATLAAPPGLLPLLENARGYAVWFLQGTAARAPGAWALALLAPLLVGAADGAPLAPRRLWVALAALPVAGFALLVTAYAPAFYALQYTPPDRVVIVPQFVLSMFTAAWGYLLGRLVGPSARSLALARPAAAALLVGAVVMVLSSFVVGAMRHTFSQAPLAHSFAATWDAYDQRLRQAAPAGQTAVRLARLDNLGAVDSPSADPGFWVNLCMARYYGLTQLETFAPPPALTAAAMAGRQPIAAEIGGVARVLGYQLQPATPQAGQPLTVTVYWEPLAQTAVPYTVFVHLIDPATGSLAQADAQPSGAAYPTTLWHLHRPFADAYVLHLPAGAPALDAASLVLGLYDAQTLQRLPVSGPDAGPEDATWVVLAGAP